MSELLATDSVIEPPDLLVEDIELGLCGTLWEVWKIFRPVAKFDPLVDNPAFNKLSTQLGAWKARLDAISDLVGQRVSSTEKSKLGVLLRAYMGKESRSDPECEQLAVNRITSLIADAALLHCLLLSTLVGCESQPVDRYSGLNICWCVKNMWERLFAATRDGNRCQ